MNLRRVFNTVNTVLNLFGVYQSVHILIIGGLQEGAINIENNPVPW